MSKRRRAAIFVLCLLAVAVFVRLDHALIEQVRHSNRESEEEQRACDLERYHAQTFAVANIVDGDTIDIDVRDGKHEQTRIRLLGIDTPETKSEKYGVRYFGPEAAEFASKKALGREVRVYLDTGNPTRGKYGRLLAYVQLPDGSFLNEALLAEGFAYADLRFRHSFYHRYEQLEAGARRKNKGLWLNVIRSQLPEWLQREKPNLLLEK